MAIKIRHLIKRKDNYYWYPTKKLREAGFTILPLGKELNAAIKYAEQQNRQVDEWRNGIEPTTKNTMKWLIAEYKKDERYTKLRKSTKIHYDGHFNKIEEWAHHDPIQGIARKDCIQYYRKVRDKRGQTTGYHRIKVLRVVMQFAFDEGYITQNPATNIRAEQSKPRKTIWEDGVDHILEIKPDTHNEMMVIAAIALLGYTGQRPGDVCAMKPEQYAGDRIQVTQSKTGAFVDIRCLPLLANILDALPKEGKTILYTDATHVPFNVEWLGKNFRMFGKKHGIPDSLQLRDLRRTAVVQLGRAGCSDTEIANITGHSYETIAAMKEVYMPRDRVISDNAMAKWEAYREQVETNRQLPSLNQLKRTGA